MTGGVQKGQKLNENLARAAQKYGIAMGVGSQRIAIENSEFEKLFLVRKCAPNIPIMANIGLVQLNYGFAWRQYQKCIDMIEADALVVHINPIQEIIQPEGDKNWSGLIAKLEKVIKKVSAPVIAKEVGFGLSEDVIKRLYNVGVRYFDVAGWGGTNWSYVEGARGKADKNLGNLFSNWGIPTVESIRMADTIRKEVKEKITILGSGGIRNGVDIAKAMTLGSDMVGLATPFGTAGIKSFEAVGELVERLALEFKTSMFGVGARNIRELRKSRLVVDMD